MFVLQSLPPDRKLKSNAFPDCSLLRNTKGINKMQYVGTRICKMTLEKSNCFLEWGIIWVGSLENTDITWMNLQSAGYA